MKRILLLLSLAFSLTVAHADLVMQQHVQSAMISGTVTTKIKGNKIRVDMPSSPQGAMSTIMDLNSGDTTTLLHQQKIAMKVPGAEVKQMAERIRKERAGAETNASPPKFNDTGKTEEVGSYKAEVYTYASPDGATETVWVARNYPNYSKIKVQIDRLDNSPVGQLNKGTTPTTSSLPGMVVKTQTEMNGQKVTATLISAKEESVDSSIFEIPKDYKEMARPGTTPAVHK